MFGIIIIITYLRRLLFQHQQHQCVADEPMQTRNSFSVWFYVCESTIETIYSDSEVLELNGHVGLGMGVHGITSLESISVNLYARQAQCVGPNK